MEIIIRGKSGLGKSRSEQEQNLRKEWGPTLTDEQLDKAKYIEKKVKEVTGADRSFVGAMDTEKVK